MNKKFIKEAKNFRRQMAVCSILCWIATLAFQMKAPDKITGWFIVPVGAIVFTIIYISMHRNIRKYESLNK